MGEDRNSLYIDDFELKLPDEIQKLKPDYNHWFLFYLRLTFKYFLRLPLWRLVLYTALFALTYGSILAILLIYWSIK